MDMIIGVLVIGLLIGYLFFADHAIYYVKANIMGVRAEIYSNTGDYIVQRVIWAVIIGWAAIIIMLIHKTLFAK